MSASISVSKVTASAPTENAQGYEVWKPSTGIVFKESKDNADSYGGIIAALQDTIVADGAIPKAYPQNFAGIISAIQDLEAAQAAPPPVSPLPIPPGTEIDPITGDLIIVVPPDNGELWFDTRQGRLFVAIDDQWWQTNGADGIAFVQEAANAPPLSDIIPGQFWFEPIKGNLYVYDGVDWINTNRDGTFQTTATVPLASRYVDSGVNPFWQPGDSTDGYDPAVAPIYISDPLVRLMDTQADYNGWIIDSLWDLDQALDKKENGITIGATPPTTPKISDLWFDTNDLSTSIYYDDGNTVQWVPIHSGYDTALALRNIEQRLNYETDERLITFTNLELAQARLQAAVDPLITLQPTLEAIEGRTLADSATLSELKDNHTAQLTTQATQLQQLNLNTTSITDDVSALTAIISSHTDMLSELAAADTADATTVLALITQLQGENNTQELAIADKITAATFHQKVQEINSNQQNYLLKSGGTFKGQLEIQNNDISKAGIDFSSSPANSLSALRFQTNGEEILELGTMDTPRQFGFSTTGKQEIAVVNDGVKQLSVTKDGVYANQFKLADFNQNSNDGLLVSNIIDVKDRLIKYQQAFESMRQSVVLSNTFDEFKVHLSEILSTL